MRPRTPGEVRAIRIAVLFGTAAIAWGEAALPGGRIVTALGMVGLWSGLLLGPVHRLEQKSLARFYKLKLPPHVPLSRRLVCMSLIVATLSMVGVQRYALFESRYALMRRPFLKLYTARPAYEVERMNEWIGPWHVQRPSPWRRWWHGGWSVGLGVGFTLAYIDDEHGDVRLAVETN